MEISDYESENSMLLKIKMATLRYAKYRPLRLRDTLRGGLASDRADALRNAVAPALPLNVQKSAERRALRGSDLELCFLSTFSWQGCPRGPSNGLVVGSRPVFRSINRCLYFEKYIEALAELYAIISVPFQISSKGEIGRSDYSALKGAYIATEVRSAIGIAI